MNFAKTFTESLDSYNKEYAILLNEDGIDISNAFMASTIETLRFLMSNARRHMRQNTHFQPIPQKLVKAGNLKLIKFILQSEHHNFFDINRQVDDWTPLTLCIWNSHHEIFNELLRHDIDANACGYLTLQPLFQTHFYSHYKGTVANIGWSNH